MAWLSPGRRILFVYLFLFLCYLGFNLLLVHKVYVHHDEGWYLYASQLVYRGKLPYLDFAYFQSPLLPYVYGLIQYLVGPSVLAGRITALTLNVSLAGLAILIARRLGGNLAAIITLLCLGTSADFMRVGSYTNNTILSVFLAMLGTWCLLGDWSTRSVQILAVGCWSLAVLARLSWGLSLAIVMGFILWHHRRRVAVAWPVIVTPALVLAAGLGYFALASFDRTFFNLIGSQLGRQNQFEGALNPANGVSELELVLGPVLLYLPALMIVLTLGPVFLWNTLRSPRQRPDRTRPDQPLVLLIGLLIPFIYLPHLLPGDIYPTYLASAYPFICILAGWLAARLSREKGLPAWALVGVNGLAIGLAILMSGVYTSIIVSWQNPQLKQLQTLSAHIESITAPTDRLLTFETVLAANTGLFVTPGTAMSYFSYFPRFSKDDAIHYRVVNKALLSEQLIHQEAQLVLLTDFDVHLILDSTNLSRVEPVALTQAQLFMLFPELEGRYALAQTVDNYGEWNNHLYVLSLVRSEN
jgi:4-amino-4-deoxy-L-arabinose transferase-like glycosyltransferase